MELIKSSYMTQASMEEEQLYLIWNKSSVTRSLYTETWCFKLLIECDKNKLVKALCQIFEENDILKSNFIFKNNRVYKYVNHTNPVVITEKVKETNLYQFINKYKTEEFDLNNDVLCQFYILIDNEMNSTYLIINHHHIVSDAQTKNLILRRLKEILDPSRVTEKIHHELSTNYQEHLKPLKKLKQDKYIQKALDIPRRIKPHRISQTKFTGYTKNLKLNNEKFQELVTYCNINKISKYTFFLTTFYYTLLHITGEDYFRLGIPFSTRNNSEDFKKMGYFVNILPLYIQDSIYDKGYTWLDRFKLVQKEIFKTFEYKNARYRDLTTFFDSPLNRMQDVVFSYQETDKNVSDIFYEINTNQTGAKFELTGNVKVLGNEAFLEIEFSDEIFNEEESKFLIDTYKSIIDKALKGNDFENRGSNDSLIQGKKVSLEKNNNLYKEFRNIAFNEKYKHKIAIMSKQYQITYFELNTLVDKLVNAMLNYKISQDDRIAIFLDRGIKNIALMIALAKMNIPFLHLNNNYPEERIKYILDDFNAKYVITDNANHLKISEKQKVLDRNLFIYDNLNYNKNSCFREDENCLEVFYTSGTTGFPKGVKITHKNVFNFTRNFEAYGLNDKDVFTHCSSLSFDASTFEIWMSLLNGCSLLVVPDPIIDIENWNFEELQLKPTISFLTTSLFYSMIDNESIQLFKDHRKIFIGGEKALAKHIKKAIKNLENVSIVNGYGPTENTTFTTTMEFNNSFFSNVPIGKPGVNVKIGVVNKRNMLLPHNCEGEIVIGGENLSSGYLNENITKEKFVTIDEVTDKLYKSGDIGYISSDSTLNYISRIDSQIKLRGYRIELSEIEENLLKHDLVSNCVTEVINNLLVLVYEGQLKTNKAKEFLTNVLPNYMVPNQIIHTDKIPLTLNGKLDKSIIEKFYIENSDNIPATKEEKMIMEVIKDATHSQSVSTETNLYEIGIDSIKSMQICSKLRNKGYNITMSEFMDCQNIKSLGEFFKKENNKEVRQNNQIWNSNELSPIQKWFFETQKEDISHWNQSALIELKNIKEEKDIINCLKQLIELHPILKSRFILDNGVYRQVIDKRKYEINSEKVQSLSEFNNLLNIGQSSLNIHKGIYNFKIIYYQNQVYIHFIIHHLVIDGVSWRIILNDFSELLEGNNKYNYESSNFDSWVRYIKNYEDGLSENYFSEWKNQINNNKKCKYKDLKDYDIALSKEETEVIIRFANQKNHGNMEAVLIAVIAHTLSKNNIIPQKSILLLEGHGRPKEKNEFINTMGWFTNIYPMKIELNDDIKISAQKIFFNQIKIPNKGIGYQRYFDLNFCHDWSFNFLGDMTFNDYPEFKIVDIFSENDFSPNSQALSNLHVDVILNNQELSIKFKYNKKLYNSSDFKKVEMEFQDSLYLLKDAQNGQIYPINRTQEAMIMDYYQNPKSGNYIIQWESETKNLEVEKILSAIRELLRKVEPLRVSFSEIDGEWYQKVNELDDFGLNQLIKIFDFSNNSNSNNLINNLLISQRHIPFDIQRGPLIRFLIVKLENGYKIIMENHHLIIDGWSMSTIFNYFNKLYDNDKKLRDINILQDRLISNTKPKNLDEFKDIFEKYEPINLPKISNEGLEEETIYIEKSDKHYSFLESNNLTPNNYFLLLWSLTLKYLFGKNDILFGVTTSGRSKFHSNEIDGVGMFVTTLPFRIDFRDCQTIKEDLIPIIKDKMNSILENDFITWKDIIMESNIDNEIQIGYVFENYPKVQTNGIFSFDTSKGHEQVNFLLALSVIDMKHNYKIDIKLDEKFVNKDMLHSCKILLKQINLFLENQINEVSEISNKLLSNTSLYPQVRVITEINETVSSVLIQQFLKYNNKLLIKSKEKEYTYNDVYNIVRNIINRTELSDSDVVAVMTKDRTKMTLYAIACFISGATYIPITEEINKNRIEMMINNAGVNCLFNGDGSFSRLEGTSTTSLDDIAYIIYTSGSSGVPKGVKVSKYNLTNLLKALAREHIANESDIWYQNIVMNFDPSIFDLLMPIISGCSMYIPEKRLYATEIEYLLEKEKITIFSMTPSLAKNLELKNNSSLRVMIIGGEKLTKNDIENLPKKIEIINMYGPTESTIISNMFRINSENINDYLHYPIGKPISSLNGFTISPDKQILPFGVVGEYVLKGSTVTQGYTDKHLNSNFLIENNRKNHFNTKDLVYIQSNYLTHYINRLDNQIKLRGYRIELGDIESALNKIMPSNSYKLIFSNNKDLILAYTANYNEEEIHVFLKRNLPSYAVPNFIKYIEDFPITINGKIDFKEIESIVKRELNFNIDINQYNDDILEFLTLCSDTLEIGKIDLNDNFFSVGGDSIKGMKLIRALNREYGVEMKIKKLFKASNFSEIYLLLRRDKSGK